MFRNFIRVRPCIRHHFSGMSSKSNFGENLAAIAGLSLAGFGIFKIRVKDNASNFIFYLQILQLDDLFNHRNIFNPHAVAIRNLK